MYCIAAESLAGDGIAHRVLFLQRADDLGDGRSLLSYRAVDAYDVLIVLVEYRIDGYGRLAGLPVADDELALAAANGYHRIDGEQPRLERTGDGLSVHDAGRGVFYRAPRVAYGGALPVERVADGGDDTAEQRVACGDVEDAVGPGDTLADARPRRPRRRLFPARARRRRRQASAARRSACRRGP